MHHDVTLNYIPANTNQRYSNSLLSPSGVYLFQAYSMRSMRNPNPIITQLYLILLNYCQQEKIGLQYLARLGGKEWLASKFSIFIWLLRSLNLFFSDCSDHMETGFYGEWSEPRENARASCAAARGGGSLLFPFPSHSRAAFTWLLRHDSTKWRPCAQARERANSMK